MRTIKFRAWDERNKVMHYDVEFIRSGTEENDWIIFKSDKQKLEDKKVLNNPYYYQQIKLMQFIGFSDKNRKDIYEEDILIQKRTYNGCTRNFGNKVVTWKWGADKRAQPKNFEIIGNRYENPNLLN